MEGSLVLQLDSSLLPCGALFCLGNYCVWKITAYGNHLWTVNSYILSKLDYWDNGCIKSLTEDGKTKVLSGESSASVLRLHIGCCGVS